MWDFSKYSKNYAVIDDSGHRLSYAELSEEAKKLSASVGERCLVFLLCRNAIGSLLGYVAFLQSGIVPLMLSDSVDPEALEKLLKIYLPKYIWLPQDSDISLDGKATQYSAFNYKLIETGFEKEYPMYPELALLLTTSGSTGSPKFVRQSYRNIEANTASIIKYLELDENERPITTLPMNYTYGLSIINTHLMVGATILMTEKGLMQKEFWAFLKEERATSLGGVPYTYEMLDRLRLHRMELPYLKTLTQAGGKISPALHEKFARYAKESGKFFVVMYGQCEATARMSYLPKERALDKVGSMGIAIPGGRFSLVDENDRLIEEPDVPGELVYEGENVTLGYAESGDDLIRGDERNKILHTGDVASFDEEGFFYIVGRKKRFLKIYGNRVNLDEVERLVKSAFPDMDFAAGGVDDRMYLFMTDQEKADEVKSFVSKKTGLNPSAFRAKALSAIPRNSSGKVLYRELEDYFGD